MSIQPGPGYTFTSSSLGTNLNIQQPWGEWDTSGASNDHPFKVKLISVVGDTATISVVPGTYNNLDPLIFGTGTYMTDVPTPTTTLSASEYSYVYISAGPSGDEPPKYPDPNAGGGGYPIVTVETSEQEDDDNFGWVLLATIHRLVDDDDNVSYVINQYVTGSLWGEYFKCGDEPALYWNTRV